ncbi:hypothetical protein CRYUN_Cryun38cG0013500 [Craigia yunnanensis]
MAKGQASTLQKQLKPNVPKRKQSRSWTRKEEEVKRLEAVAAEMRAELNHMKRADRKAKAKLRKLQKKNSESRKANRLTAMNNARIQLYKDAILHLLDD